ncbi:hypothetical protein PFMG_00541 [Plasmodium falciparum IGH-CR14]|uniref:DNAJ-containing protein X-domain domain-containing protein n=1 Tax=Plasmodium falciparum IGH-CR14 TaxID=580059 RepID=A0A0L1I538_PLAFA|nr:hypothetical protein PFMG_00541 [Plasmodium falciparum IGH-CR14]
MIIEKNYDFGQFDLANKNIIIDAIRFFNLIFTYDMMYEYIRNTKVSTFVKLFFEKNISILNIFYYVGKIMKELMEGQNIRDVDELLKDILDLYIHNEDEYEILVENEISITIDNLYYEYILNLLEEEKNEILEEILRNILKIVLCDVETTVRRSAQKVLQNAEGYTNLMFKRGK